MGKMTNFHRFSTLTVAEKDLRESTARRTTTKGHTVIAWWGTRTRWKAYFAIHHAESCRSRFAVKSRTKPLVLLRLSHDALPVSSNLFKSSRTHMSVVYTAVRVAVRNSTCIHVLVCTQRWPGKTTSTAFEKAKTRPIPRNQGSRTRPKTMKVQRSR